MKKIAFVIPYFGKFPEFFDIWLKTANFNETIDFIFFTDIDFSLIKDVGKNIIVYNMSFDQIKNRIQSLFDFDISLERPYKLCDYKPAYGKIFENELKEYDYWGHCDIDMVFGNIRKFVTDDLLDKCDRFHALGFFSIYKNNEKVNTIFKYHGTYPELNYEDVFSTDKSCYFDEYRGMFSKTLCSHSTLYKSHIHRNPKQNRFLFYELSIRKCNQFILEWNNGNLYSINVETKEKEEICYAHLFRRKFLILKNGNLNSFCIFPNKVVLGSNVENYMFLIKEKRFYRFEYMFSLLKKYIRNPFSYYKTKKFEKLSNEYNRKIKNKYNEYLIDEE